MIHRAIHIDRFVFSGKFTEMFIRCYKNPICSSLQYAEHYVSQGAGSKICMFANAEAVKNRCAEL